MPLIFMVSLLSIQVGLVGVNWLRVQNAAREGARQASISPGDYAKVARQTVERVGGLDPDDTTVTASGGATTLTVWVDYSMPTQVPIVGNFIGDISIRSKVTMFIEPKASVAKPTP